MTIAFILVSLYLVYYDIKLKKVPNIIVLGLFTTVLAYKIVWSEDLTLSFISGAAALISFLLIYIISRGKIGIGDIKYTTVSAFYFGYEFWLKSIIICSASALVISLILLASGRINRETRIPFIPFLVTGILVISIVDYYL